MSELDTVPEVAGALHYAVRSRVRWLPGLRKSMSVVVSTRCLSRKSRGVTTGRRGTIRPSGLCRWSVGRSSEVFLYPIQIYSGRQST